jgi:2-polyprenyl-6-methoxyphenol hydroxylase-like FAD-dependent oxidoreductase
MRERAVKTVLISGASIAGPALAFWLDRYGIDATVVEKAASLRGGGYPIDVRGTAIEAVERMGLYAQMRAAHVDSQSVGFVDAHGAVVAKIDPEGLTGGVRGKDIEIRRGDIAATLYAATKDTTNYKFNDSIAALEEHADGVDVTFVGGATATYDIVIGADGLHSNIRSLVFGHESQFERYIGFCFAGFTMPKHSASIAERSPIRFRERMRSSMRATMAARSTHSWSSNIRRRRFGRASPTRTSAI